MQSPRNYSVLVLALVVMLFVGCSSSGKKVDEKTDDEKTTDSARRDRKEKPESTEPFARLTATQLLAEVKKDPDAAHKKYEGKVLEVTGLVFHVGNLETGGGLIQLKDDPKSEREIVTCGCKNPEVWRKALPGQMVKLRGRADSLFPYPVLLDCETLDATGPLPAPLTVNQFAKECAADLKAAEKKYKDVWVLLSGEVEKLEDIGLPTATVTFKADLPKSPIEVGCDKDGPLSKALKQGQKVTLLIKLFSRGVGKFGSNAVVWEVNVKP